MAYKVNKDMYNVSTTMDAVELPEENGTWTIDKLYNSDFTLDELVNTLNTVAKFRKKYPDDETFQYYEESVREEICHLFGGSIDDEYYED